MFGCFHWQCESAVLGKYSQALQVSDQVILVTSLMDGRSPEELNKGVMSSLQVDSLQLSTYNLLRGRVKDVLRDAQSFSQTYKFKALRSLKTFI